VKRTSILVFLVALTAACVAAGFGATAAKAAPLFCTGSGCPPSTQGVTPTSVAVNPHCDVGGTEVDFTQDEIATGSASHTYSIPGSPLLSGSVSITYNSSTGAATFSISGGAVAVEARLHGGAGQGGFNGQNVYDYSGFAAGGVTSDGNLYFTGPQSSMFICLARPIVLAVTTSSFNAAYQGRSVTVRWRTSSEVNVLGFNLYRQLNGKRVKLNRRLIPSANVLHGKSTSAYSFRTRLASERLAASSRYVLQEVHTSGSRTLYGPIRARNAA
jgi:hypothetical protein